MPTIVLVATALAGMSLTSTSADANAYKTYIVTGGGPGLMEAANEGAASSRGTRKTRSFGLTISIPYEKANPYLDTVTAHRTFFSRLHHFVRMSQAFIIFPGGIGTSLELFMVWQLLQVGFLTERPVVLVGDMWRGLLDWMRREMVSRRLMDANDLELDAIGSGQNPDQLVLPA